MLHTLIDLREGSVEAVGKATGLRRPEVSRALDRLADLNYAIKEVVDGKAIYRPVPRMLGE